MQIRYLGAGIAFLALMLAAGNSAWAAEDVVAYIKTVEPVTENDVITTGPTGSVGMTFTDNTRISLGPNSEFRVSDYLFAPDRSAYSFVSKLTKGTMEYASGLGRPG
jgi:hypothetical protein